MARATRHARGVRRSVAQPRDLSGMIVNEVFYGSVIALSFVGWIQGRRAIRRKRGLCIKCGYDLRGDFSAGCPECGWRREGLS